MLADHGAFNGVAQPTKFPAGFFHIFTGSYDYPGGALQRDGGLHQQGTRRRRLRLLVPHHRGGLPDRAHRRLPRGRARHGPGRAAAEEPAAPRAVPLHHAHRLGVRLGRLREDACAWRWTWPATTTCAASRPRSAPRRAAWASASRFFTEGVGAGPRKHMDILGLGMADGAELRVHPTGKARACGSRCRARARATRRRSPRSSPTSSASRPRTSRSSTATPTTPRSASAPTARGRRRSPARRRRWSRARCATRPR